MGLSTTDLFCFDGDAPRGTNGMTRGYVAGVTRL